MRGSYNVTVVQSITPASLPSPPLPLPPPLSPPLPFHYPHLFPLPSHYPHLSPLPFHYHYPHLSPLPFPKEISTIDYN